jgi:hypothetical protein
MIKVRLTNKEVEGIESALELALSAEDSSPLKTNHGNFGKRDMDKLLKKLGYVI